MDLPIRIGKSKAERVASSLVKHSDGRVLSNPDAKMEWAMRRLNTVCGDVSEGLDHSQNDGVNNEQAVAALEDTLHDLRVMTAMFETAVGQIDD